MPKINVNGSQINYLYFGNGIKSKPVVIFIHGAAQSSGSWEYQYNLCRSYKRFNSIVPDLPGHGESDGTGFTSIQEYSDFLNDFINKLKLREIILVGHSMGGRISQVFILNHPENVIGTVLAGTGARIRVAKATLENAKNNFEKFCELAARNSFSQFATKELREKFLMRLSGSSQMTCINDLTACNEFDVMEDISKINVPTLIIAGEDDILAPVKHSNNLYKKIPDSRLERIKGAGHFMIQEKPDEFNQLLTSFLNFL
ncbi:MAG: alpha/beta fold hydrolase [Thermodesulfobacteriota bacterium]